MWNLIKHFTLNLFKTKIFYLTLVFAFVVHFVTLKTIDSASIYVNEVQQVATPDRVFWVLFLIQLAVGSFVSMVYGVWIAPYLHQGDRAALTFSLPVAKWKFPVAYAVTLLVLITIQNTMMFTLHGFLYGYEGYAEGTFPFLGLVMCNFYEIFVLEVTMLGFAVLSLLLGKIVSLFLGILLFFITQVVAVFFATDMGRAMAEENFFAKFLQVVYRVMPPWDRVLTRLSEQIHNANLYDTGLISWALWTVGLLGVFALVLHFPRSARGVE